MSTIMETMTPLHAYVFLLNINKKCIKFDDLTNGKRQNDVERCNTTC